MKTNLFSNLLKQTSHKFFANGLTIIGLVLSFISLKVWGINTAKSIIISTIIIFISFLLYLLIRYFSELYKSRTEEFIRINKNLEDRTILLPENICINDIYPYTIEEVKVIRELKLNNETFKFDVTSNQYITVKGGYDEISYIEGSLGTGTSLSHKFLDFEIELNKENSSRENNGKMELEIIKDSEISQNYRVNFYPPLKKNEIAKYHIIWKRKSSIYISSEFLELDKLNKIIRDGRTYETFNRVISTPTKKYYFEIIFPKKYVDIKNVSAIVTKKNIVVDKVTNYLRNDFKFYVENSITRLVLNTENPLVGFKYSILWTPPKIDELINSNFISKENEKLIKEKYDI